MYISTPLHGYTVDTSQDSVSIGTAESQVPTSGVYLIQSYFDANDDQPALVKISSTTTDDSFTTANSLVVSANAPLVFYVHKDMYVHADKGLSMHLLKKVVSP